MLRQRRPMTAGQVIEHTSRMNVCYQRIVTALLDLDVMIDEAEQYCTDEKALEYMREVRHRAYRLVRPRPEIE